MSSLIEIPKINQDLLDLDQKERSNVFPWRGQFSPELVENLLRFHSNKGAVVFDPFAGVGTTLLEAAKLGMRGRGTELNPSAFIMAQTVEWARFSIQEKESYLHEAEGLLNQVIGRVGCSASLPNLMAEANDHRQEAAQALALKIKELPSESAVRQVLANCLIRGMSNGFNFYKSFEQHRRILLSLPVTEHSQRVFHADARNSPLAPASVDFVLTSPPYINVFNYHENNRPAMELLGWDILSVAKAELGSNRKNRQNRFLTVIQYCIDMHQVMLEIRRVMKETAKAVIVVGRESNVRGLSFRNGEFVVALSEIAGFKMVLRQERQFVNRFGKKIVEDVLFLTKADPISNMDPREIALHDLRQKTKLELREDIRHDLHLALNTGSTVAPSPLWAN